MDDPNNYSLHGYPHTFSPTLMRTLGSVFETFIPSIPLHDSQLPPLPLPPPPSALSPPSSSSPLSSPSSSSSSPSSCIATPEDELQWKHSHDHLQSFYGFSAAHDGVPSFGAGLICSKLNSDLITLVKLVLLLLSSKMGTFLLCGKASLCWKKKKALPGCGHGYPIYCYARAFPDIPLQEREKILLEAWSHSPKQTFRKLFNAFKIFTSYSYFTKLNKQGSNLAWNAIGYCGPDPAAIKHRQAPTKKPAKKPLDGAVLDAMALREKLSIKLQESGFEVLKDVSHLESLWKKPKPEQEPEPKKSHHGTVTKVGVKCDVVIVGSGAGGGVMAAVLAKAGYKVLVVEKGQYLARDDLSLLEGEAMDKMYEGGGILPTEDANVLVLAGSTVGGGTAINWSASLPTPTHVLDEWSGIHGLSAFGPGGEYQDAMRAVLARLGIVSERKEEENIQNKVLREGCESLGLQVSDVPTNTGVGGDGHSCGWCGFGCWSGTKQSTSETWLVDAISTGNARIVTGLSATCVLLRKGARSRPEAAGLVAGTMSSDMLLFVESQITVVSGGALSTPVLLQRSGLRNPNIGKHLRLHPVQLVWGYFPTLEKPTYEGPIISAMCSQLANLSLDGHGVILQCPSVHPGVFSVITPWLSSRDFRNRMRRFSRTVSLFALARDHGSGTVGSHPCLGHRKIRYALDPRDERNLLEGGVAALRVLIAAGASEVGTHHRYGDSLVIDSRTTQADVESFLDRVRSHSIDRLGAPLCSAHQMGSCRMGIDPRSSAVSPTGETWDVSNLFVADSSVLPTALGVNPMVTIQSVAYCIARQAVQFLQNRT